MYAAMVIFTFLALYPIIWLILQSFKTTQEYMLNSKLAFPVSLQVDNYIRAWNNADLGTLILNSIFYTSITVSSVIALSFLAGFAFAKLPSKLTPVLHGCFIIGILLTLQSIMVPLFLVINTVGLLNTRIGVLIPYIGIGLPIAIYLSTAYIRGIPNEVLESARIDGAKYISIFFRIILPMAAPVAATVAILGTTGTWNEFMLINILVSRSHLRTLPVGIAMFAGTFSTNYGQQFSSMVIGMSPMIIFYFIFRKQITKGVTAGAIKG